MRIDLFLCPMCDGKVVKTESGEWRHHCNKTGKFYAHGCGFLSTLKLEPAYWRGGANLDE